MKIGKFDIGLSECNEKNRYCIFAWNQSSESSYWRVAVFWNRPASLRDAFKLPSFGPCKNMGTEYFGHWGFSSFSGWAFIPLMGGISVLSQPPWPSTDAGGEG
jgi:hypothetical protein